MKKNQLFKHVFILLIAAHIFLGLPSIAQAAYSVGFATANIQITSPTENGQTFDGRVQIEGKSQLDQLWLCIRGPQKEVFVYPVSVKNGAFSQEVVLRFGPGKYTVWAGDNARKFDGSIRFEVVNAILQDNRYLAPSSYVDSENTLIIDLSETIVKSDATEQEKLFAVHNWVTENVTYDVKAYNSRVNELKTASQTMIEKTGLCRDYAFLTCALYRAMDMPARVVYGHAVGANGSEYHAWNEVQVNGEWISLDTTWDAGYLKNGKFVSAPSKLFLNPQQEKFSDTHQFSELTIY